jgi:hypothetical protein
MFHRRRSSSTGGRSSKTSPAYCVQIGCSYCQSHCHVIVSGYCVTISYILHVELNTVPAIVIHLTVFHVGQQCNILWMQLDAVCATVVFICVTVLHIGPLHGIGRHYIACLPHPFVASGLYQMRTRPCTNSIPYVTYAWGSRRESRWIMNSSSQRQKSGHCVDR